MGEAKQVDFLITGLRNPSTDEPLSGGYVWTYEAGTATPKALYLDRDTTGGTHSNPLQLDAFGRAKAFGNDVYKFVVRGSSDDTDPILFEIDNAEYVAELAEGGIGPLTTDLDFNFFKGINLAAGTVAGNTVEYQQFTQAVATLNSSISNVQTNLNNATFTSIGETPNSFSTHALKLVRVNAAATAVEFIPIADIDPPKAFTDLTDAPKSYTGHALKRVSVKADASGLEFTSDPTINKSFLDLTDTPANYTGAAGKFVKVKSTENGLEFVAAPTGDVPIGTVVMHAGTGALSAGWLECAGQALAAADYPDLAATLGVAWGSPGLGQFNLPDLRGIFPIGAGTGTQTIKDSKGGAYAGGSVGAYSTDAIQGHDHNTGIAAYGGGGIGYPSGSTGQITTTRGVINDIAGLYGTVRQSHITKPASAAVRFIIRVL